MRFGSRFSGGESGGRFTIPVIVNIVWRIIQFILGIVVIAFYATEVRRSSKPAKYDYSRFVFALVIGIFGTISAAVYAVAGILIPLTTLAFGFPWEWILTILWAAVAGLFSSMYLHYYPPTDQGTSRMRVAAGFDLANLITWGLSAIAATAMFFMRSRRSLHTGRATV